MKNLLLCVTIAANVYGCGRNEAAPAARIVVDSIRPVAEEIRRFKIDRGGISATALAGGAASRDDLVEQFIAALEKGDTAAFARLALTPAEFIDLYYPASIFARPPYRQSPEVRWLLLQEQSSKGLTRLLQRFGGQPTGFRGYSCTAEPKIEGANRVWDHCVIDWGRQPSTLRAFSTILERDGRFKILSYANDL